MTFVCFDLPNKRFAYSTATYHQKIVEENFLEEGRQNLPLPSFDPPTATGTVNITYII